MAVFCGELEHHFYFNLFDISLTIYYFRMSQVIVFQYSLFFTAKCYAYASRDFPKIVEMHKKQPLQTLSEQCNIVNGCKCCS